MSITKDLCSWPFAFAYSIFLVLLVLFIIFFPRPSDAKNLQTDLEQIRASVREWPEELAGFVDVNAADIPADLRNLNDEDLQIYEADPNDTDSQRYVVYRRKQVDTTKYTRHVAYLRRFQAVSAVEWSPFYTPEDAVSDGSFVEILVPTLYLQKRCNSLIATPARAMHNFFYRQDWNCTLPNPYQDCCGKEGAVVEKIKTEDLGRAVNEAEGVLLGIEGTPIDDHLVGGLDEEKVEEVDALRPKRGAKTAKARGKAKRKVTFTKKIGKDEEEILADQLKKIEGPPGYFALGEFYQDVLDLMNGSEIVYAARERVALEANESAATGQESEILQAETALMTIGPLSALPIREDPTSAFTGYLSCSYSNFNTSRPAMDKLKGNVIRFYLHKLRAQCLPEVFGKADNLFETDMVQVTTGLRTALMEPDEVDKELLSAQEWNNLISSIMLVSFSNAYMDVAEKMTRGVHDNRNPLGEEISLTVRTLTVVAIRTVEMIRDRLRAHVVKTLQIVASMAKEKFFASLNDFLKLENFCITKSVDCTKALRIVKNDQLQLIGLMQFVIFGTSGAMQKKERSIADEFNKFYIKTLKHTEDIFRKVHKMRKFQEEDAQEDAKEADAAEAEAGGEAAGQDNEVDF